MLRCFVCSRTLESCPYPDPDERQPWGATVFVSHGNYGSTVWDPCNSDVTLEIFICDWCLRAAGSQGDVTRVQTLRPPVLVEATEWEGPDD